MSYDDETLSETFFLAVLQCLWKKTGLNPETKKFVFDVFLNGRLHNDDSIWQEFENYHLVASKISNYMAVTAFQ
jgi:hypothetical protein